MRVPMCASIAFFKTSFIKTSLKVLHLSVIALLGFSLSTASISAPLKDRLEINARHYADIQQSLFIDIEQVGSRLIAVGEGGAIIYSDNNGASWMQAEVPVATTLTAVHFPTAQLGWAVGHSGIILHSSNAGQSWVKQFDGNQANKLVLQQAQHYVAQLNTDYEHAGEDTKEELEYQLEDAEFIIEDAQTDVQLGPAKPMLDVWFRNESEGYVVGAYGFFFKTSDGGKTWHSIAERLENIDRYHLNAIRPIKGGAVFIVGEAGQIFVSRDDGDTWETLFGPYQGSLFGVQETLRNDEVLIYGLRGNIFRSVDAGLSWERISIPVETTLTSSDLNQAGHITLVGHSGIILRSRDGGINFTIKPTERFDSYSAVKTLNGEQLVLVGDKGVQLAKP